MAFSNWSLRMMGNDENTHLVAYMSYKDSYKEDPSDPKKEEC